MLRPSLFLFVVTIAALCRAQNSCDSLQVGFSFGPDPAGIQFSDSSLINGPIVWYQWTFGDGEVSFAQDPVHAYLVNGSYEACLTISTQIEVDGEMITCTDSACHIVVYDQGSGFTCDQYQASFEWEAQGNTITFLSTTDPPGGEHLWQFGDGDNGSGQQAAHTYADAATYTACLVSYIWSDASQEFCTSSTCQVIPVGGLDCAGHETGFTSAQITPYEWSFTSTSTPTPTGFSWEISDGTLSGGPELVHTFSNTGTYEVCLGTWWTAGQDSCWSSSCQMIQVVDSVPCDPNFVASFSFEETLDGISFTAIADSADGWLWDLGDGTTGAGENIIHEFDSTGVYSVCLYAWYWNDALQDTCWTYHCQQVIIGGCDPNFEVSIQVENDGMDHTFTALANLDVIGYIWDLGDGTETSGNIVSHTYNIAGPLEVCVNVWYWNEQVQDTCWANACIVVDPPVGISDRQHNTWSVYPQPAGTVMMITGSGDVEWVRLISIDGRSMMEKRNTALPIVLNVAQLPAGTYILEISAEGGKSFRKPVIIE
jgi:PKD repeat protein